MVADLHYADLNPGGKTAETNPDDCAGRAQVGIQTECGQIIRSFFISGGSEPQYSVIGTVVVPGTGRL